LSPHRIQIAGSWCHRPWRMSLPRRGRRSRRVTSDTQFVSGDSGRRMDQGAINRAYEVVVGSLCDRQHRLTCRLGCYLHGVILRKRPAKIHAAEGRACNIIVQHVTILSSSIVHSRRTIRIPIAKTCSQQYLLLSLSG
jgi:hypothetical protein